MRKISIILLFLISTFSASAQNLNGSWYEDTLHERSRFRDYFYRINDTQLSVIDKKNNKQETFFEYTIKDGFITINSTGKASPKIDTGKFPIVIKDENYFTINFSIPMSFVRNSYATEQAKDVRNKALVAAGTGAALAGIGVIGEKAVVSSGVLAGPATKANATGVKLSKSNGVWQNSDRPGNSKWIPDNNFIPDANNRKKTNPNKLSWKQIKEKYNFTGIDFKEGYPDFSKVAKAKVTISDFSHTSRDRNFAKAYEQLVNKMGKKEADALLNSDKFSWHEAEDCKTLYLVPTIIHGNVWHEGGFSNDEFI